MADVEESIVGEDSFAHSEGAEADSHHNTVSATVGTRRQANGTIGSVYSGNKIKHLKKEDGIPLWRKDIQYQFLKLVFEDTTPCFTRLEDGKKGCDFADIYIECMARSSKTSKILKDKLQNDKPAAISMAMVCLLVNFGRMNTTLNFFPEMRAQLRTYHSIPSLQAQQDPNAYKQLQDAPRLKSILKGASEDTEQPNSIEKIKQLPVPRTNPVNLIFVLSQDAPKISEWHFFKPRDFFDLVMRSTLSSRSRARAFLWLMWWYLESDFSVEAAKNNPFGPGLDGPGTGGLPIKVPAFESLTEEQAEEENRDTEEELRFGEEKRLERKRILEEDEPITRVAKRSKKSLPEWGYDDDQMSGDGRNSLTSTPIHSSTRRILLDEEEDLGTPNSGRSRYKRSKRESSLSRSAAQQRLILRTKMEQTPDGGSPAPGSHYQTFAQFVPESGTPSQSAPTRRPRPLTQHQLAVEHNRRQRIEYLLAQRKSEIYRIKRIERESELSTIRYGRLLSTLPDNYDTEEDEHAWGKGGLIPNPEEHEDYGEAANYYLSVIRKAVRRLDRWDLDDSNGPKRDRKKEREERQKRHQETLAAMNMLQLPGRSRTSATTRSRGRNDRNARRKAAGAETGTVSKRSGGGGPSRSKATKRTSRGGPSTGASKSDISPSSPRHTNHEAGDETLDDIDKELLGEATENEGDEDQSRIADVSAIPGSDLPENGYEDSFVGDGGDDDAEGLSSDNDLDGDDDDELDDEDDNSSGLDDTHAEADSSSEVMNGDQGAEVDVEGDVDHEVEEDEVMDDVED